MFYASKSAVEFPRRSGLGVGANKTQAVILRISLQEVMEQVLSVLYGASGIAASALYIPQIIRYHRDPNARQSISLLSWGGWIGIAFVTILYALYVVKSPLFAMVASLNVVAQITVLFYGLSARWGDNQLATAAET
jgi:hypothetical protein